MAWDDWVFGALTLGAYNVGKTAYKAGKAAEQAGDSVEEFADGAGTALAAISSTITKLGIDISSFLKEIEELITIKRLTPRNEDDLWDEEVERLNALRQKEAELVAELQALEAEDDDRSWWESFWDAIFGGGMIEELMIRTKLAVVRNAIDEILYQEPGIVSTSIYQIKEILERFNTLEQPRLEEILDSMNDNLEESKEILQEVKKLFVIKTWKAVPIGDLPEIKRQELERLEASLVHFDHLIANTTSVSGQLREALLQAQPGSFQLPKMVGTIFRPGAGAKSNPGPPMEGGGSASHGTPGARKAQGHSIPSGGPTMGIKGKVSTIAAQPMAVSVGSALNQNAVSAYLDNYNIVEGRLRFYLRERLKVEKAIFRIKWVLVEEPGVIPKTLDEVYQIIGRFRREGQPRMENILDNVNLTVVESKNVLSNVNKALDTIRSAFDFLSRYSEYLKIGLAVTAGLMLLILLFTMIVLFRHAFSI